MLVLILTAIGCYNGSFSFLLDSAAKKIQYIAIAAALEQTHHPKCPVEIPRSGYLALLDQKSGREAVLGCSACFFYFRPRTR